LTLCKNSGVSYQVDQDATYLSCSVIPLVTQSDAGTENFGIANSQTLIRQMLDPQLAGTIQHRWVDHNIKPEIAWSQFRSRFARGFENVLEVGVTEEWYDPYDALHRYVSCLLTEPVAESTI
jgi:hypothetical protein